MLTSTLEAQEAGVATPPDSLATLRVSVTAAGTTLADATVRVRSRIRAHAPQSTNASGLAVLRLPPGTYTVIAGRLGFQPDRVLKSLAAL